MIIEKLNEYLQTFKPFNDFYRTLVGDDTKNPIEPIENINDENTGTIANPLMWLSDMQDFLIKQININTATDKWLTGLKKYYGIPRIIGELDSEYRERLKKILLHLKESDVSIKNIIDEYCEEVEILDGLEDGMFDDISFDDYYIQDTVALHYSQLDFVLSDSKTYLVLPKVGDDLILSDTGEIEDEYSIRDGDNFKLKLPEPNFVVREAVEGGANGNPYYFRVILTNPDTGKLKVIYNLVEKSHTAGTYFDIFIITT